MEHALPTCEVGVEAVTELMGERQHIAVRAVQLSSR